MPDPKRPTKEEALPHTMDPPKPLTAEELTNLFDETEHSRLLNQAAHGISRFVTLTDEDWLGIRATIDHLMRRAEAAEARLKKAWERLDEHAGELQADDLSATAAFILAIRDIVDVEIPYEQGEEEP